MLVKYKCLPLSPILACINYTGQHLTLLQVGSVGYMYSDHCTVSATRPSSAFVQGSRSSTFLQGSRLHQLHPEISPSRAVR